MKHKPTIASLLLLSSIMLAMSSVSFCDDDKSNFFGRKKPGVAPVTNPQYLEECGSCHFPYQPGLLPKRSWTKLMTNLEDHFEENAELPLEDVNILTDYLLKNAANHANYKRSRKIMKSLRTAQVPLRASETPYLLKKHNKLSRKMVQDNPKVSRISRCKACHTRADKGSFSEREILIPGFGRWDD